MVAETQLAILIRLKDEASAGLQKFNTQLKANQKELEKTKLAWGAIAKVATAVGVAIVGSMGLMVRAAEEERISQAKLANMLNNVGVAYSEVRKELEASMATTARKTGISDEKQRDALSQLIMTTGNYKRSTDALSVALDLSAARGIDATSAAWTLGKAMAGNTTMLKRYGIVVKDNASAEEVLIAVNNAVGGSAKAMASPFAILKDQMSELGETIGKVLLPALSWFVGMVTKLLSPIRWLVEHTGAFGKGLVFLTAALGAAALGVGAFAAAMYAGMIPALIAGAAAAAAFVAPLLPFIAIGAAVGGAIYGIVKGIQWLSHHFSTSGKEAKKAADQVRGLKKEIADLNTAIIDETNNQEKAKAELTDLQKEYDWIQLSMGGYRDTVLDLNKAIETNKRAQQTQQDIIDASVEAVKQYESALSDAKRALEGLSNVRLPGMQASEDAIQAINEELDQLALKSLKGGLTKADKQRIADLEKQRDILEAQAKVDFGPQLYDLKEAVETAEGANVETPFQDAMSQVGYWSGEITRLTGLYDAATVTLTGQTTALGGLTTELEGYEGRLQAIYDLINLQLAPLDEQIFQKQSEIHGYDVIIKTKEDEIAARQKELEALQAQIAAAKEAAKAESAWTKAATAPTVLPISPTGNAWQTAGSAPLTGFQHGGIVTRPTLGLVGEAGPEAVVPLSRGGVGSTNITVNVQGSVIAERDLTSAIREQLLKIKGRNYNTGL